MRHPTLRQHYLVILTTHEKSRALFRRGSLKSYDVLHNMETRSPCLRHPTLLFALILFLELGESEAQFRSHKRNSTSAQMSVSVASNTCLHHIPSNGEAPTSLVAFLSLASRNLSTDRCEKKKEKEKLSTCKPNSWRRLYKNKRCVMGSWSYRHLCIPKNHSTHSLFLSTCLHRKCLLWKLRFPAVPGSING